MMATRQRIPASTGSWCRVCSSIASSSSSASNSHRLQDLSSIGSSIGSSRALATTSTNLFSSINPSSSSAAAQPRPKRKLPPPIRLSTRFSPTQKADSQTTSHDDSLPSLQLLLRGGYIRSSSSGVFTLLPNSLRILSKITRIIDSELTSISASRLSLPVLLPSKLWRATGRYSIMGSELYKLRDRKDSEFVLGPTHEEEITKLVSAEIDSDRQLPLRLYQVTRKFRDEPRPRMGLLRTKEFLMKDLYSFDRSEREAVVTYEDVRGAYGRIFDRVFGRGGWKAAEADSGAIGGSRSHEYHVEDPAGEDTLISCSKCSYTANTEKAVSMPAPEHMPVTLEDVRVLLFGCSDVKVQDQVLHAFVLPTGRMLNETKLEKLVGKLRTTAESASHQQKVKSGKELSAEHDKIDLLYDSASPSREAIWDWKDRPEGPLVRFTSISVLADFECASLDPSELNEALISSVNAFTARPSSSSSHLLPLADLFPSQFGHLPPTSHVAPPLTLVDIRTAASGDTCPSCRTVSSLKETKAIEIGHTFYLGEKYSRTLEAGFHPSAAAKGEVEAVERLSNGRVPFQMGCYGIGVSRILGALAQKAAAEFGKLDAKGRGGFAWPKEVAPFTGVIVVADMKDGKKVQAAEEIWGRIVAAAKERDGTVREVLESVVHSKGGGSEGIVEGEGTGWSSEEAQELVIDDRSGSMGSKLADADLTGYSYRLIIGKHFAEGNIEVQYLHNVDGWKSIIIPIQGFGPAP